MNIKGLNIQTFLMIMALTISSPAILHASSYDNNTQEEKNIETRRQALYKDLNLSQDQKKSLEENKKARREEMKSLFSQMKEKRETMRSELQKNELNLGKITQINNELKILSAQILDHKLEGILEVRKILTPEQFKKFITKVGQRQERFGQKRD